MKYRLTVRNDNNDYTKILATLLTENYSVVDRLTDLFYSLNYQCEVQQDISLLPNYPIWKSIDMPLFRTRSYK